ncbi:MAG: hypothetical protein K0S33_3853 [Bacteroidetes bacterium]|jgi:hypothetical protein|nr:hypothetical protein [Bacteroidota bacterium]
MYTATFTISDADNDTMSFQIASSNTSLIPITTISITNIDSVYTLNYSVVNNQTETTTMDQLKERQVTLCNRQAAKNCYL